MITYRHSLADPEELFRQQRFYASAVDQEPGIHRVYELATKNALPQVEEARSIAKGIASNPPKNDSPQFLAAYVKDTVVSKISGKTRYDDVFWCCLLHILDLEAVPNCSIGGPFHNLIYRIYDDFDPEDVIG